MKIQKVNDILIKYSDGNLNPKILELTDSDGTIIYSYIDVLNTLEKYSEFFCKSTFDMIYQSYKRTTWVSYLRAYKALQLDYNPLHNFDSTEKSAYSEEEGEKIESSTPNITSYTTAPSTSTTENFFTTDDNANARLNDKSTTTVGSGENISTSTTTGTSTLTTTHENITVDFQIDDISTHTGDKVTTSIVRKFGNAGVLTTTQSLLENEITLRKKIILDLYISAFADDYFFIGGAVDDIEIV